jgi:asparagine synthase (glutamine-hydrolysing)
MCGIFSILNSQNISLSTVNSEFIKGSRRGPEFSKLEKYLKMTLGFHRLAINGLNNESNQPLIYKDVILICNGEIYNYKELFKAMNIQPKTGSDCEVIIHLYLKYGIEQTLNMLDGVFSFVLFDNRLALDLINRIYIARDPLGVRPLYYLKCNNEKDYNDLYLYGFASELKCLEKIYNLISNYTIEQFTPGTYSVFQLSNKVNSLWKPELENISYFLPVISHNWLSTNNSFAKNEIYSKISYYLKSAVYKRCITTERPIACLLSGGLDSSLVAGLVNNYYKCNYINTKLETYSIGLEGSEDLKYARIVADYLQTKHTEIIVTEKEMFEAIPEVIIALESYDTTTVRASVGNYLLGKYIKANSEAKVIFNGDGSDELFGGYLYMNLCPDDIEFDKETRRLLKDIYLFDVLRSDKSISSHGLEPRTPFLDRSFVNYILSIPPDLRNHNSIKQMEKYILRNSFSTNYFLDYHTRQILPDNILFRSKEAFSDGVSSEGRSLNIILQEQIALCLNQIEQTDVYKPSIEIEKMYYKKIFDTNFPNCSHILPYFWMPKYTSALDPSARTLPLYKLNNNSNF